jgi:hypothetical protein
MKYFYFLLFSLLVFGCKKADPDSTIEKDKTYTFQKWPKTVQLASKSTESFEENLYFPTSINAIGKYLVFTERAGTAKIKIFSLDDYSYITSYGKEGQGPNEFVAISGIIQDEGKNQPYLTFYDWGKKLILKHNIDRLANDQDDPAPVKQYVLPPDMIQAHKVFFSPIDSTITGFGGVNKGKLFNYNIASDTLEATTPFIPRISYSAEQYKLGKLYRGPVALNPINEKIAVASRLFSQLEIYDYELNLLKATRLGKAIDIETRKPDSKMEVQPSSDSKLKYTNIDFNEENIFLYYENRTLQEMNEGVCHNSEIHTYNWEGNPEVRYQLEGCPNFIAYDHINRRFIGIFIFPEEDGEELIRYYQL